MRLTIAGLLGATLGIGLVTSATPVLANDITGTSAYHGTIKAVAPGYFYDVGVSLADGYTCAGSSQVFLLANNPKYNEIIALLLTAQITHAVVALAQPAANPRSNYGFCTISEAAVGDFPNWP